MATTGAPSLISSPEGIPVPVFREKFRHDMAGSRVSADQIQRELLGLALQQREVQRRIRAIRDAISALVHVFGPCILSSDYQPLNFGHEESCRHPAIGDLCRKILADSPEWLTVRQILGIIRQQSPSALACFINPGASLSNALRTMLRHAEVEAQYDKGGIKWRRVEQQNLVCF